MKNYQDFNQRFRKKYTIESGKMYFKSLLRGSILYAAEAMVNLKEKDIKLIDKSEENILSTL